MKTIFVFAVCCLAVALAGLEEERKAATELHKKYQAECREEVKLTGKEIEDTVSSRGCYEMCMHNKFGHFNADGTVNLANAPHGEPQHVHRTDIDDHLEKVHSDCLKTAEGDKCKLGYCLYQERKKHIH